MDIKCPKCGSITTIRTRNKDGRKFYVCVRYPKCKGKVEQEWDEERVVDSQEEQPKKSVKPPRSKKPAKSLKKWYVILIPIAVVLAGVLVVILVAFSNSAGGCSQEDILRWERAVVTYEELIDEFEAGGMGDSEAAQRLRDNANHLRQVLEDCYDR